MSRDNTLIAVVSTKILEAHRGALSLVPARFLPRHVMEEDTRYRQVIPYIIFRSGSPGNYQYALFRRLKGEEGLVMKTTIGIGGHIEQKDMLFSHGTTIDHVVRMAAQREMNEELVVKQNMMDAFKSITFMYGKTICISDENIDKVHLGIPVIIDLYNSIGFSTNDGELQYMGTLNKKSIGAHPNLESWTKYYLEQWG